MPPRVGSGARAALVAGASAMVFVIAGASAAQGAGVAVFVFAGVLLAQRRRRRLAERGHAHVVATELPDVVDLLAATLDGGVATEIALSRIAEFVEDPMRSLLLDAIAHSADIGAGARLCALHPALRPLGSLLRQSEELGVPIAGALRLLAADARARARSAARERAAAAAPKMLLVVGALLAPASLLIVIGGQVLVLRDVAGGVLS